MDTDELLMDNKLKDFTAFRADAQFTVFEPRCFKGKERKGGEDRKEETDKERGKKEYRR